MAGTQSIEVERDVGAEMRDGTVLRADVYRPSGSGRHPVLLQRNPYNKNYLPFAASALDPIVAAMAGYVVIVQDVRGRWASEGDAFYPYRHEAEDGFDSVEWAAGLPYADGNVGMYGISYMGGTQWHAALERPPSLKAILPVTSGSDAFFRFGGAVRWGVLAYWALSALGLNSVIRAKAAASDFLPQFLGMVGAIDGLEGVYREVPPSAASALDLADGHGEWVREVLEHDTYDDFHDRLGVTRRVQHAEVPSLSIAGWYDLLLGDNLHHFETVRERGASSVAREQSRLMVGPWAHAAFMPTVGQRDYGLASSGLLLDLQTNLTDLHLRWFDHWLRGEDNGVTDDAAVKLFVMGDNAWRDERGWPLARAETTPLFLRATTRANGLGGGGRLSFTGPGEEPVDRFLYDPTHPVPTLGSNILMPPVYPKGPVDRRQLQARDDVLVYTTEPLDADLEVTGPVTLVLHAATSAVDTDFTATLSEVLPDGRAFTIVEGIVRASYRRGPDHGPEPVTPDEVVEYRIDLLATSNVFRAGHALRLEVSSSNFPRFDRNPNTGERSWRATRFAPAVQTVFHDRDRPSHLLLPVVART